MYRPVHNHPSLEPVFQGLDKMRAHEPHTGSAFYTDAYGKALYGATQPIIAGPHGDRFATLGGTPLGARIDALIDERKDPSLPGYLNESDREALWRYGSRRFAEEASGPALALTYRPPETRYAAMRMEVEQNRNFTAVELSTLIFNPNVTSINNLATSQMAQRLVMSSDPDFQIQRITHDLGVAALKGVAPQEFFPPVKREEWLPALTTWGKAHPPDPSTKITLSDQSSNEVLSKTQKFGSLAGALLSNGLARGISTIKSVDACSARGGGTTIRLNDLYNYHSSLSAEEFSLIFEAVCVNQSGHEALGALSQTETLGIDPHSSVGVAFALTDRHLGDLVFGHDTPRHLKPRALELAAIENGKSKPHIAAYLRRALYANAIGVVCEIGDVHFTQNTIDGQYRVLPKRIDISLEPLVVARLPDEISYGLHHFTLAQVDPEADKKLRKLKANPEVLRVDPLFAKPLEMATVAAILRTAVASGAKIKIPPFYEGALRDRKFFQLESSKSEDWQREYERAALSILAHLEQGANKVDTQEDLLLKVFVATVLAPNQDPKISKRALFALASHLVVNLGHLKGLFEELGEAALAPHISALILSYTGIELPKDILSRGGHTEAAKIDSAKHVSQIPSHDRRAYKPFSRELESEISSAGEAAYRKLLVDLKIQEGNIGETRIRIESKVCTQYDERATLEIYRKLVPWLVKEVGIPPPATIPMAVAKIMAALRWKAKLGAWSLKERDHSLMGALNRLELDCDTASTLCYDTLIAAGYPSGELSIVGAQNHQMLRIGNLDMDPLTLQVRTRAQSEKALGRILPFSTRVEASFITPVQVNMSQAPSPKEAKPWAERLEPLLAQVDEYASDFAMIERNLGNYQKAEALCRQVLKLDPNSLLSTDRLIEILGQTGRAQEAEALARRVIQLDPTRPKGWLRLGECLAESTPPRVQESVDCLARAAGLLESGKATQGRNQKLVAHVHTRLARLICAHANPNQGLLHYVAARINDPSNIQLADEMASVFMRINALAPIASNYEFGNLKELTCTSHFGIGWGRLAIGDRSSAATHLAKARQKIATDNPGLRSQQLQICNDLEAALNAARG